MVQRDPQLLVAVTLSGGVLASFPFCDVSRPILVGSAATCQVRVPLPNVLPVHAEIVLKGSSLHILDRSGGSLSSHLGPISEFELPYKEKVTLSLATGVHIELTSGIIDG